MTACTPKTGVIGSSTRAIRPATRSAIRSAVSAGAIAVLGVAGVGIAGWHLARHLDVHELVAAGFVGAGLVLGLAAAVDVQREVLPNRLLLLALGMLMTTPVLSRQPAVLLALAAGMAMGAVPMIVALLARPSGHGIGIGDVKFAAVLGAAAGLVHPLAAVATVFVAAVGSSTYAAVRRLRRLPLGPWLWGGFALSAAVGSIVLEGRT